MKKSTKQVAKHNLKSKTAQFKRSETIKFSDHVQVVPASAKGKVSMKVFTVPLKKAGKLNLKVVRRSKF